MSAVETRIAGIEAAVGEFEETVAGGQFVRSPEEAALAVITLDAARSFGLPRWDPCNAPVEPALRQRWLLALGVMYEKHRDLPLSDEARRSLKRIARRAPRGPQRPREEA